MGDVMFLYLGLPLLPMLLLISFRTLILHVVELRKVYHLPNS